MPLAGRESTISGGGVASWLVCSRETAAGAHWRGFQGVCSEILRTVSQENVEIVRRFIDTMQRSFEAYWENPRSIAAAVEADDVWPEYREALTYLDPEFEWKTAFLGETHRG